MQLKSLMLEPLPKLTFQRKKHYRTHRGEVISLFNLINKEVFSNELPMPEIEIKNRCRNYWGKCTAKFVPVGYNQSHCIITMSNKWFCKQWLISILAHEMCHQYQWDILGKEREKMGKEPVMNHGPSFFLFRDKLHTFNIPLRRILKVDNWFKYQNLMKC